MKALATSYLHNKAISLRSVHSYSLSFLAYLADALREVYCYHVCRLAVRIFKLRLPKAAFIIFGKTQRAYSQRKDVIGKPHVPKSFVWPSLVPMTLMSLSSNNWMRDDN